MQDTEPFPFPVSDDQYEKLQRLAGSLRLSMRQVLSLSLAALQELHAEGALRHNGEQYFVAARCSKPDEDDFHLRRVFF